MTIHSSRGSSGAPGSAGANGGDVAIVVRTGGNAPAEVQIENQGGAGGEGARLGFAGNLGRIKNELP